MNILVACEESQEIWKDIPGYEGKYQASTLGKIRSVDRTITRVDGKEIRIKAKTLSSNIKNGYPHVNLGVGKTVKVHSLIALTFLGQTTGKMRCKA